MNISTEWRGYFEEKHTKYELIFDEFEMKFQKVTGKGSDHMGHFKLEGDVSGFDCTFKSDYKNNKYEVKYKGKVSFDQLTGTWETETDEGKFQVTLVGSMFHKNDKVETYPKHPSIAVQP